ncbi:MAG: LPS export ABC transporter periplasmic protein LptC [Neisseria sp.]|nr:LPS export ABC transporter periplasmic protein LptC [Neisseria sp.]
MSLKWRYGWLFPLVLAALLGGLSAWLERVSEVQIEETELNPNEPQYAMRGISGKRFGADGKTAEHLTAEKAWQLPKSDEVVLETPQLTQFSDGLPSYRVSGGQARYDTETREVVFEENVVLNRYPRGNSPEGIVETEKITVDTRNETARSDAPVTFRYGASKGSAEGFTYDHKQGLLKLPAKVKAMIYANE